MTLRGHFLYNKYFMEQFVQTLLLVAIVYFTLIVSVRTMFGEYTRLYVIMATVLIVSLILLTVSLL